VIQRFQSPDRGGHPVGNHVGSPVAQDQTSSREAIFDVVREHRQYRENGVRNCGKRLGLGVGAIDVVRKFARLSSMMAAHVLAVIATERRRFALLGLRRNVPAAV
jgi:hypothetical protein